MFNQISESQASIIAHNNNDIVGSFLTTIGRCGRKTTIDVANAVVNMAGVDKFSSFAFVRESYNDGLIFSLDGFNSDNERMAFYKKHKEDIKVLLSDILKDDQLDMAHFIKNNRQYFNDDIRVDYDYSELAQVFESEDTDHPCYEALVSVVVCAVVDYTARFFISLCKEISIRQKTKGITHNDCLDTPKGMVYTYLSYEPFNEITHLTHALIDDCGYETFVFDARKMDKLDTFKGYGLTCLPTRYSRVRFFVNNAKKVKNWIAADLQANSNQISTEDWLGRIKRNDAAGIFDTVSISDAKDIIFNVRTEHQYFDEVIDLLMLHVVIQASRDFTYFCKSNGYTFNRGAGFGDESVKVSIYEQAYNKGFNQAKADILKVVKEAVY